MTTSHILYIEPFYGGSHQQLVDLLQREFGGVVLSLPATKWHWRMRVSSLHFALTIPREHQFRTLFASSVLNLCELVALRPDLASLHKVLYCHENQLVYPVRKQQERDFQFGYNQILSCLVADSVLFNSHFNMDSFLNSIDSFLKLIPDHRPRNLPELIRPKCRVVYFPLELPVHPPPPAPPCMLPHARQEEERQENWAQGEKEEEETVDEEDVKDGKERQISFLPQSETAPYSDHQYTPGHRPLHILWSHRWEHDKGPDELCAVLQKLMEAEIQFNVSVLGSHTNDIPISFQELFPRLGPRLLHYGPLSREEYWQVLREADVVLSTAKHEFFGVAMLEATHCGCYPLCPNRLVYPEIYPKECLYNTEQQLFRRLVKFSRHPPSVKRERGNIHINFTQYSWTHLKPLFVETLRV